MGYKPIPARLFADPSGQVEFRRNYDRNEKKMEEVRRLRRTLGCQACVSSEMQLGVLTCRETGECCDRPCRLFWVNV